MPVHINLPEQGLVPGCLSVPEDNDNEYNKGNVRRWPVKIKNIHQDNPDPDKKGGLGLFESSSELIYPVGIQAHEDKKKDGKAQ